MGSKRYKTKVFNDRFWKLGKQAARKCSTKFAAKIAKTKTGISSSFIEKSIKCLPNFIGCFAEDELSDLTVTQFPCFLVVNIDSSQMQGSHWLAIGLFRNEIEIFDPMGFKIFNWPRVPCDLLKFLHRMSVTRKVSIAKRTQSNSSHLCGFYCLFYLFLRPIVKLRRICSYFYSLYSQLTLNDFILYKFLQ